MNAKKGFTRRGFIKGAAATAGALALPWGRANAAAVERKFLFLFASGGWDVCQVFESKFGASGVDMDPDTVPGRIGDIDFVDGPLQAAVGYYFGRWGHLSAIVNSIDSHSVGHGSCTQFMLTGTSADNSPDWPTILASSSVGDYPLPQIVFSGPSFPGPSGEVVVRGGDGTILDLIDGSIVGRSDRPAPVMSPPADSMVDAAVHARMARYAAGRTGGGRERADALITAVERSMELEGRRFEAGLNRGGGGLYDRAAVAIDAMRFGLCRTATVAVGFGWDTHGNNDPQETNFQAVFTDLDLIMEKLATTPGLVSEWLIDEVVVVMMSEMGRTPRYNGSMGRDHWPYTSALVAGSGVKGNQVIGASDDGMVAQPIDFKTGKASASGDVLACESFGAGLLTLGGVDSNRYFSGVQPLRALLRSG